MKCFNCSKNFDYEKYYGICPKCGCFNKKETAQEQHQRYHDAYDGGYQHPEHTHSAYIQPTTVKKKSGRGSTIFLIVSIIIWALISFGGTALSVLFKINQEERLQKEDVETPAEQAEHAMGEAFCFQGMTLTVSKAWVLDEGWESNPDIPAGKKLVAVKLAGTSDGEWADKNQMPDAYIRYGGLCYWQIPAYEFDAYEERYGVQQFRRNALYGVTEREGCLMFWIDEDEQEFTLCLEERTEGNSVFIEAIHSIKIHLEEGQTE